MTASVSGHAAFLEKAPIAAMTKVQQTTSFSITESVLTGGTDCAPDMVFAMRVLESAGLKAKKPMVLQQRSRRLRQQLVCRLTTTHVERLDKCLLKHSFHPYFIVV
jgi:hypothetical protein